MANKIVKISAPVGIRNGVVMPNTATDLAIVTDLFDRILYRQGGTAEIGGLWATGRTLLIDEVTAQIIVFQTVNHRPKVDGVLDPNGGSIQLMNQLAAEPPPVQVAAAVVPAPDGYGEEQTDVPQIVAEVNSVAGLGPLRPITVKGTYVRKLVRVDGSSIKWFGVVIPKSSSGKTLGSVPHLNFTPTPIQGGYSDANYDTFGGWGRLWLDYTGVIGGQMAASGVDQIVVLPFYRTSQAANLGDFLDNWQDVVSGVLTAAINSVDPLRLWDTFTFDRIVTSSFSNGFVAHLNFQSHAAGAAGMTDVLFDLDGVAGGSHWRPAKGIIYQNRTAPRSNPAGNVWYVGGRWSGQFAKFYPPGGMNTHACCRNHLLYHGLLRFCS